MNVFNGRERNEAILINGIFARVVQRNHKSIALYDMSKEDFIEPIFQDCWFQNKHLKFGF